MFTDSQRKISFRLERRRGLAQKVSGNQTNTASLWVPSPTRFEGNTEHRKQYGPKRKRLFPIGPGAVGPHDPIDCAPHCAVVFTWLVRMELAVYVRHSLDCSTHFDAMGDFVMVTVLRRISPASGYVCEWNNNNLSVDHRRSIGARSELYWNTVL